MSKLFITFLITIPICFQYSLAQQAPLEIGVIGLTHSHVGWILGAEDRDDIKMVAIVESDRSVAEKYAKHYGFSMDLVYATMEDMLKEIRPDAVTAFGPIYDHLEVVETCAPLGIHVMVEKPLAVSMEHATRMSALAKSNNIHLLTNYETSWYPTNHKAKELLDDGVVGELRRVIVRDGHKGPKKIGVPPEFLNWLTDPILNGGGALTDFGCYGANLVSWLQDGKRPRSVTAVTQQLQPENNPKVDDEATIILTYDNATAVIEASWNWPIGRKDMELYGLTGAILVDNRNDMRVRLGEGYSDFEELEYNLEEREYPHSDPFAVLAAVINETITLKPYDLYSLENNVLVVEILDAARESAKLGRTVYLD